MRTIAALGVALFLACLVLVRAGDTVEVLHPAGSTHPIEGLPLRVEFGGTGNGLDSFAAGACVETYTDTDGLRKMRTGAQPCFGSGSIGQKSFTLFDPSVTIPTAVDIPSIFPNRSLAYTITEVCCEVDDATGTSITLFRDDGGGEGDYILNTYLSCATTLASACTSTFQSCPGASCYAKIAVGQTIDFVLQTNTAAKRITVTIKTTTP